MLFYPGRQTLHTVVICSTCRIFKREISNRMYIEERERERVYKLTYVAGCGNSQKHSIWMELFRVLSIGVLLLAINANEVISASCDYPAIFNFGDSNSDTGGISAAFYPPASPSGQTYFHRPAGRASDGRLLAGHLGLPYLNPYLDSIGSIGSSYRHGTNFATGGATILRPDESWFLNGVSPFSLEIQVEHYTQLKDRTAYFHKAKKKSHMKKLPRPDDFSKSLFLLDIGQNDVAASIRKRSSAVPEVVSHFIAQIKTLYEREAKIFWIHNTGPIGCLPVAAVKVQNPVAAGYLDEHGCVKSQNDIAIELNKQLKNEILKLRSELSSEAKIIYVDMYSAKLELITTAYNQDKH
ncbi:hypothetical protein OROGR_006773 [Orobanche gracilis]